MWIEKTKSGGLRLVDRIKINGKVRRVIVPLEKDTPQARRKAMEALLEKSRTVEQETTKTAEMSLSAAISDYLELKDCRESTRATQRSYLRHTIDIFGDIPLHTITPALARRKLYGADHEPSIINLTIKYTKTFFRWCVEMEYMTGNPLRDVRSLKIDKPEKDPSTLYLEPDQLQELLSNLSGMNFYLAKFLALTGCRIGEAIAVTPQDITERYIIINKAFDNVARKISKTKNVSSVREVYIQPELRELLTEYLKWRNLDMMAYGLRPKTLFYSRTGGLGFAESFRDNLRKYGLHPHILRHTHVALLAEQGMSLEAIARRIGHNGTGTTEKVYYHVTKKQREKDEMQMQNIRIL